MKFNLLFPIVALPLVSAIQHPFGLLDDLLAAPQYSVVFTSDYGYDDGTGNGISRVPAPPPSEESTQDQNTDTGDADIQVIVSPSKPNESDRQHTNTNTTPILDHEIMFQEGMRYLCDIPTKAAPSQKQDTPLNAEAEKELIARATGEGLDLLKGMGDTCFYLLDVWWAYQFCYNDEISQFRPLLPSRGPAPYPPTPDPNYGIFTLGRYPTSAKSKPKSKVVTSVEMKGESRYLSQVLTGGTVCDLTGRDREIEVRFKCNAQATSDKIIMLKEVAICSYLMIIYTPRLCNAEAFLPPQASDPSPISCAPILDREQLAEERERGQNIIQAFLDGAKSATGSEGNVEGLLGGHGLESALAIFAKMGLADVADVEALVQHQQIVGGIVVGGKKEVGMVGKVIEKSAIVGGRQVITVVADSKGFVLSLEELKKIHISSLKEVEVMKKSMESMAKGREWRLESVKSPTRREFRGVLYEDDDADDDDAPLSDSKAAAKMGNGDEGVAPGVKQDGKSGKTDTESAKDSKLVKNSKPAKDGKPAKEGKSAKGGNDSAKKDKKQDPKPAPTDGRVRNEL